MDVRLPDGTLLQGVPDGMSKVEILGRLQRAKHPSAQSLMQSMASQQALGDTSTGGKVAAGAGLAFANVGRAAKQMLGMDSDYAENKASDRALMRTGAGAAGNVAGNIAMFAPLSVIPGANTVAGAGAIGATVGAFQPAESDTDRLVNMGAGGALGAGTQALTGPVAQRVGEWGASRQADAARRQSQNAVADETLARGREAGYVLPPSAVTDSFIGKRLESIAGKAALGQEAAIRNQPVTDRLAREAAGITPEQPISLTNLRAARQQMAAPYRDTAALSPQAAADLQALQGARHESKLQWKAYNRSADPNAYRLASAADQEAALRHGNIVGHAQQAGRPELVEALVQARQRIAQNRQVQEAMNRGTGSVDASVIGRSLDNGAPLTGPLETIGRFQQAYKPYMREGSSIPTPGVSKSEALSGAILGTAGGAAGGPAGVLAGGLPLISGPTRSLLLSRPVQEAALTPNYSTGALTNAAATLHNPETRRRAALLARSLALPTIPQAVGE